MMNVPGSLLPPAHRRVHLWKQGDKEEEEEEEEGGEEEEEGLFIYLKDFKRFLKGLASRRVWQNITASFACCCARREAAHSTVSYRQLKRNKSAITGPDDGDSAGLRNEDDVAARNGCHHDNDCPLSIATSIRSRSLRAALEDPENSVIVKISILGDSDTGKTSFIRKYVTDSIDCEYVQTTGVSSMGKVFKIQNAKIALNIWELGGACQSLTLLAEACQDSAAVLVMFDLTRRSTLNSVKDWFLQAKQCNKAFLLIIVGNKYDQFVQMPKDIQLAIIRQARFYTQVMGASLFFSSITHNINVYKIFKVLVAKLFDLPCSISQNVNFGEPLVEY